eukprot:TRINITY_DN6132_c0_g1_i1.p1 TRINITY_DN6132_c0_g1~~TRINITY_DN6132_c0_g1_i1.p1  ORF type:complete len:631 (+),score=87.80 TRINITY_DN6132_c0_g1_i1:52-1944(+)
MRGEKLLLTFCIPGVRRIDGAVKVAFPTAWTTLLEVVSTVAEDVLGMHSQPPDLHLTYYDMAGEKCTIYEASFPAFVEDSQLRRGAGDLSDMKVSVTQVQRRRPLPPRAGSGGGSSRRRRPHPAADSRHAGGAGSRAHHRAPANGKAAEYSSSESSHEHQPAPVPAFSTGNSSSATVGYSNTSASTAAAAGCAYQASPPYPRPEAVNVGRPHPSVESQWLPDVTAGSLLRTEESTRQGFATAERQGRRHLELARREVQVAAAVRMAESVARESIKAEEDVVRHSVALGSLRQRPPSAGSSRTDAVVAPLRYHSAGSLPPRRPTAPRSAPPTRRSNGVPVGLPALPVSRPSPQPAPPAPQLDDRTRAAGRQLQWDEAEQRQHIISQHHSGGCEIEAACSRLWLRAVLSHTHRELERIGGSQQSAPPGWGHRRSDHRIQKEQLEIQKQQLELLQEMHKEQQRLRAESESVSPLSGSSPQRSIQAGPPAAAAAHEQALQELQELLETLLREEGGVRSRRVSAEQEDFLQLMKDFAAASAHAERRRSPISPPARSGNASPKRAMVVAPGEIVTRASTGTTRGSGSSEAVGRIRDWPQPPTDQNAPPIHPMLQAAMPFLLWPMLRYLPDLGDGSG